MTQTIPIHIREADMQDCAAIASLSVTLGYPATAEDIARRLLLIKESRNHIVLVAEHPDGIIGWLHAVKELHLESGEFAEIAGLIVGKIYRGSGTGGDLLTAAENWARKYGCNEVRVRTNVLREQAPAFYEHRGFRLAKQQKVYVKRLEI